MTITTLPKRVRADGTRTYTSPDWDARWYWPVGTRVRVGGDRGIVTKQNAVSVRVRLEDGRELLVQMRGLVREDD